MSVNKGVTHAALIRRLSALSREADEFARNERTHYASGMADGFACALDVAKKWAKEARP